MKKSVILLTALLLLMLNFTVMAQDEEEEWARDVLELSFFGGVDGPTSDMLEWSDSLGAKTGYNMGVDIGYFVSNPLVAGISFRYAQYSIAAWDSDEAAKDMKHRIYNPQVYAKYYLMPYSSYSPYVKANVGLTFNKFTTYVDSDGDGANDRYRQLSYKPSFSYGIGAGGFIYTADYGGLFIEGNYHIVKSADAEHEYEGTTYVFGDDLKIWEIHAGLRILIGSGD